MAETIDIALLAGRILFGGYFLLAGINHFTKLGAMAPYAQMKGVPAPKVAVLSTGLLLVAGGASVLLGLLPRVGLASIAVFLLGVTPAMHAFWKESDPTAKMGEQTNFLKNTALLGAAIALYAVPAPWAFAL